MIALAQKLFAVLQEGTLPVMLPLVAVCVGIGLILAERGLYLFDARALACLFHPRLRREYLRAKGRLAEALDAYIEDPSEGRRADLIARCEACRTPYSRFLLEALAGSRLRDTGARDPEVRSIEIERAQYVEEAAIERGFAVLSSLTKLAPLLGLLGTVTGMIRTFGAMMLSSTSDPKALSSGISIALIATNVGLVVALPGVVGMGWLSRRARTLQEEITLASMRLRTAETAALDREGRTP
ncbi:MAG: MotA/TolQ/ExbB proton channel family protein [Planctomycetes bacterium]|nr:MotA/TolQ/ExbB proton channel family protein [Planctomycetota bacterium]